MVTEDGKLELPSMGFPSWSLGTSGKLELGNQRNQPKIIFVNRFFYPDHSATSQLLSDLAFALARQGREICVVTSRQRYDDPDAILPLCEKVAGVSIQRAWSTRFGRTNLLGRAMDYLSFYLGAAWTLACTGRRGDVIVAKTDPPMISVVAAAVAKMRGAVLINWLQDLFPEVAVGLLLEPDRERGGLSVRKRLLSGVFKLLQPIRDWSLRRARYNVVIGDLMRERLLASFPSSRGCERISPLSLRERPALSNVEGVRVREFNWVFCIVAISSSIKRFFKGRNPFLIPSPRPLPKGEGDKEEYFHSLSSLGASRSGLENCIRVIHNWSDGEAIKPVAAAANPLRKDWGVDDKFVIGYSGNLGRAHEIDTLLAAMELLRGDSGIVFLFIGGGAQLQNLKNACESRRLSNVLFKPYQPRANLQFSLSAADAHLIMLHERMEGLIVPSKFYGIAAAGRASVYIGARNGEIAAILREAECGLTVPPGDGAGLAATLRRLAYDPVLCKTLGSNARTVFEQRFEQRLALQSWSELLDAASLP